MQLNDWGQIGADAWAAIPDHFAHATLDAFVVMPNHVHGIVWLRAGDIGGETVSVGARHASPLQCAPQPGFRPRSVASIVASFKSAVTKRINETRGRRGVTVWQRNFYEHIIRGEAALHGIRQYIADNPANWPVDELYTAANI